MEGGFRELAQQLIKSSSFFHLIIIDIIFVSSDLLEVNLQKIMRMVAGLKNEAQNLSYYLGSPAHCFVSPSTQSFSHFSRHRSMCQTLYKAQRWQR